LYDLIVNDERDLLAANRYEILKSCLEELMTKKLIWPQIPIGPFPVHLIREMNRDPRDNTPRDCVLDQIGLYPLH
jgi:hypothetical protein